MMLAMSTKASNDYDSDDDDDGRGLFCFPVLLVTVGLTVAEAALHRYRMATFFYLPTVHSLLH